MLGACALLACAESPDHDKSAAVGSTPAIRAIELSRLDQSAPRWTSTPEFSTLGLDTLQLGGGQSFFARFLDDGTLIVANGSAILRLSRRGEFDGVVARGGDGPGEFRVIMGMGISDDGSLFAADHLTGRFTQLQADGELVRTIPRLRPIAPDAQAWPIAALPDGRVIAMPWQWQAARDPDRDGGGAVVRDPVTIAVYDSTGEPSDTIAVLSGLERSDGFVVPFPRSAISAGRGGRQWAAGVSDSLDLTLYDGTEPKLRLVANRLSIPISDRQRAQRDSAVAAEFGGAVGEAVIRRQGAVGRPTSPPDIGGIAQDAAGRIWVGMHAAPGSPERQWFVFARDGRPLGQLAVPAFGDVLLPRRTEILDIAAGRIALIREADGAAYIEVRRVVEREPGL